MKNSDFPKAMFFHAVGAIAWAAFLRLLLIHYGHEGYTSGYFVGCFLMMYWYGGLAFLKEKIIQPLIDEEIIPKDVPYIDLGWSCSCVRCYKRYCICVARQNGTWENRLPIVYPKP